MRKSFQVKLDLRRLSLTLLAVFVSALPAAATRIEYRADEAPVAFDPVLYGWSPFQIESVTGPLGRAVIDTNYGNRPAWQVTDSIVGGAVPNYYMPLQGPTITEALTAGWRFQATARLVDSFGADPSQGLAVFLNNVLYLLVIERTLTGQLRANLFDNTANPLRTHTIASGAAALDYVDYEFRYDPTTALVTFLAGGIVKDAWNGAPSGPHGDVIQWGSGALSGAGQMNFRHVVFSTIEPPARSGDYNVDGRVNAADYTIWRDHLGRPFAAADGNGDGTVNAPDYNVWKSHFGDQLGAALATHVPEPPSLIVFLAAIMGIPSLRGLDNVPLRSLRQRE